MASSNTLLTPTVIAKEALMMLMNGMVMGKIVHKQFKKEFKKVGSTITVRKPNKFRATKAQARTNTDLVEPSTTLAVATQAHVSWAFSSVDLTMTIDEYSKRYIQPAANALANQVDVDILANYVDIHQHAGTPGTTPSNYSDLGDAQTLLDNSSCPTEGRVAVLNPTAHWSMADGLKGTFAQKQATDIITKGYLGTVANLAIHMDQNIQTHTTGTFTTGATPVINDGAIASGDLTLVTAGWNAGTSTITEGDIFTMAGVNSVNPVSGASTGSLKQFTVTTAATSAGGAMTVAFTPAIINSGAYQTVDALPANGAALTFSGTEATAYSQNIVCHPNCFTLVCMPMQMPSGVWGARETFNDVSIRVVKQYDVDADEEIIRMDILYGTSCIYPELGVRLTG